MGVNVGLEVLHFHGEFLSEDLHENAALLAVRLSVSLAAPRNRGANEAFQEAIVWAIYTEVGGVRL